MSWGWAPQDDFFSYISSVEKKKVSLIGERYVYLIGLGKWQ